MTLDLTSFDAVLKQYYTNDKVENMTYQDNPLHALLPKMEQFGGKNLPIPVIFGNPQGRSKTFSNAQTRSTATSTLSTDFVLTRVKDYSIATIDNETLEASKGNNNAFMEALTTEIDGAINALTRSVAIGEYRDSSAALGQVSVEPTEASGTFVVALKVVSDVHAFEVGQVIVAHSAKSGGSQRTSDGSDNSWPVAGIDRGAGTLTLTGTYDGYGTIAANDFLFVEGDRGLGISGLEAWIPYTAPDSTPFFGVDRTADVVRLAGCRLDGSALPIEEALISGASLVASYGHKIDHFVLSFEKYAALEKALGSKVQYVDLKANAEIGFRGMLVNGPRGPIKVIADQNCPQDRIYGLKLDSWKLYSLGKAVRIFSPDGLEVMRQASADGVEVRVNFYGNMGCKAPGANIVIKV